ncbi:MAG TPA: hypothetical protein ENK43_05915 [Planctomycetes bacterium]|nr:hypothetical protein [Planctomycetota bacterium]
MVEMIMTRFSSLMAVLFFSATMVAQAPPSVLFAGKPVIGATLRLEVTAPFGTNLVLLADSGGGPNSFGGYVFDLDLGPNLQIIPLGVAGAGPVVLEQVIPNLSGLVGLTTFVQIVGVSPSAQVSLSQGYQVTVGLPLPMAQVDDYCYQLQGPGGSNLSLSPIASTAFDLSITDFSSDGTTQFTAAEVGALQSPSEPQRIRLAYMSIGEAEDYRWYWPLIDPTLVAQANPQWAGNFKVKYWDPAWKDVIIHGNPIIGQSYLDRIIDQGFDGVYLDIIDAFEFFGPSEEGGVDLRRDAAREMVQFVLEIAHHARVVRGRPDFLVVPQNGSTIITDGFYPADTLQPGDPSTPQAMAALMKDRYFRTIDAIGVEDVFYTGGADENNPYNPDTYRLGLLSQFVGFGLPVLNIEYLTVPSLINDFYTIHAPAAGFVPYSSVRDLDILTVNSAFPPN